MWCRGILSLSPAVVSYLLMNLTPFITALKSLLSGMLSRNNGLHRTGKNFLETTVELAEFVGFRVVETLKFTIEGNHFARYHTIKGHNQDLWHEYVLKVV